MKLNAQITFRSILALLILITIGSCKFPATPTFQKEYALKNAKWDSENTLKFEVEIKDTGAVYQSYILLRHDDNYPYSNIWLRLNSKLQGNDNDKKGVRLNLKLADLNGVWLGKGMGSIWEHKIPLSKKEGLIFEQPGIYEISLTQIMREDPLTSVLNAGLVIQKRK